MGFCNFLKNVCIETTIKVLFLHDHLCKEKPIFAKNVSYEGFLLRDFYPLSKPKAKDTISVGFFLKTEKKKLFKYS